MWGCWWLTQKALDVNARVKGEKLLAQKLWALDVFQEANKKLKRIRGHLAGFSCSLCWLLWNALCGGVLLRVLLISVHNNLIHLKQGCGTCYLQRQHSGQKPKEKERKKERKKERDTHA